MSRLNTAGDEEEAARAVWQKILYAWAWGSTDYIWYNLRATGWNPSAGEDSYGLITPDYRPRATYAAFAALATLIEGGRFDARLVDAGLRHVYRFHTPGGKGLTIAGWDAGCWKGEAMRIRSDAKAAWAVDLMGNRTELKPADGLWTWTISREPSAIVLDGATRATIEAAVSACGPAVVLPDSPTAVEKSAAKELADGLEKCLGKRPEVVSEGAMREGRVPARPCLFVGATKASAAVRSRGSATLPAWETDGVLLKSVKDGVVLDGDPARAPIYAVDLYLEKYCGVRWWTSDAATYPKLAAAGDSRPPVPVEGIDLSYAPQFKYRETYYLDGFDPLFKVRSKGNFTSLTRYMLTDMEFIPPELGGNHRLYFFEGRHSAYHSFFEILPPNTYFGAHPEWYSLVGGKRQPKQLCLANAEMKAEYIAETLKRLREDSSADFIQVSQNDWHGYCQCEKCKAMMDEDGGAPSGPYLRFANDVAEAVEKEFPKVRIDTFAYQFTRQAPTKTRPRHNVVVRLCDIECDFARPLSDPSSPLNAAFAKDIADWKRVAGGNLYIWDYLANFWSYMLPHPNISQIAPNIRLFAENGAVGIFEQGDALCSAGSFATLRHYMAAHLLWDPSDDENRLMDEFLSGYYGKSAAPALRKFIEVVDDGPWKTKMTVGCGHRRVPFLTAPDKLLAARLMDEAVAAAEKDGEPFAARVRRERLSVDHYLLLDYDVLRKFAAKKNIPWTRPETRAEAATNWMREVRAFGVKASRETTSAGEIEAYLAKICDDEAFSNYMKAAKPDKIRKLPSPAARP